MTDVQTEREAWLAAAPFRSPEVEQARFGGDVPAADQLELEELNPFNAHLFRDLSHTGAEPEVHCIVRATRRVRSIELTQRNGERGAATGDANRSCRR